MSASLLSRVRGLMRREADRQAAEQPPPARAEPTAVTPSAPRAEHNDPGIETLETEARHHRFKLALYQARMYAGKPTRLTRLRELERTSAGADARLKRARGRRKRKNADDRSPRNPP